ncbi:hypothetical protein N3K66_006223 [Trichothecium roseum]|uniref:Uncharacterized protein n=1 Tax=Trichothecium roseum TaxID=47278 RepID=A0ACC0V227_9HYPO|nr:hypothetical protein N3K66_006223 [Trichothecium roseum]
MSERALDESSTIAKRVDNNSQPSRKRSAHSLPSDARYPRKRSLRACHVCRARKTKCDNVRPTCGFCSSLGISCTFDDAERDHSTFDAASLEIIRQLGHIISTQDELLQATRSIAESQSQNTILHTTAATSADQHVVHPLSTGSNTSSYHVMHHQQQQRYETAEYSAQHSDSASTTPAASTGVAAVRWFGLLANLSSTSGACEDASAAAAPVPEGGFLDLFHEQKEADLTPLQWATKIIDGQSPGGQSISDSAVEEEDMWRAPENIVLLDREQDLFENFLLRICPWLEVFDPARTFSTKVPRLALRNAGLLNAIMALSGCHQLLGSSTTTAATAATPEEQHQQKTTADQRNDALQSYYQTLHYVQKAMRYPSYQASPELMATTLIVSTYEMLRGSRTDWQQHLQGVFWILRSRQIEVERHSTLESTTWWAWLRQDVWAAFRGHRRTYSTWTPRKYLADLGTYELAARSVWILAQVVNFCAAEPLRVDSGGVAGDGGLAARLSWAGALGKMMRDWEAHLPAEFTQLPVKSRRESDVFKRHLIHPQCFGLAMQVHHVSQILLCAHEPSLGGLESFMRRQEAMQNSIEVVCGIAMELTEDASSMMASQCIFIAGMFIKDARQRRSVLEMLQLRRNSWPSPTLTSELQEIWDGSGDG